MSVVCSDRLADVCGQITGFPNGKRGRGQILIDRPGKFNSFGRPARALNDSF